MKAGLLSVILCLLCFTGQLMTAEEPEWNSDFRGSLLVQSTWWRLPANRLDEENLLGIPRDDQNAELRLDFRIDSGDLRLRARPRLLLGYTEWREGQWAGQNDTRLKPRLQELSANLTLGDQTFLSYGIQPVSWGNALLVSPSNPFLKETGRLEPQSEMIPADFLRLQWLPEPSWSFELLTQTGRAESQHPDVFSPTLALKTDYVDARHHLGLVLAKPEGGDVFGGFFLGRELGEATQLYLEAGGGASMQGGVLGIRQTSESRWIFTLEFAHQTLGNRKSKVSDLIRIPGEEIEQREPSGERISRFLRWAERGSAEAPFLSSTTLSDLLPLRKNYLLLQAFHPQWGDRFQTVLQYVRGLDDDSGRVLIQQGIDLGSRIRLFGTATLHHGHAETEWGALLRHQFTAGFEILF